METTPTTPVVSIIMPVYNRERYIAETIDSILGQTYKNWELIIVDDGSVDDTEKIVTAIKDKRISFFKAGRIGINGKIKNIGLEKINGSMIAFMDSDDCWAPSKLEKQVAALLQYPEAGFVLVGGYNFIKTNVPTEFFYKPREGMLMDSLFISFFTSRTAGFIQALMLKKECLQVTGNFSETESFSDIEFLINTAMHFKGIILYEPLLYRRIHEEGHSSLNWEKNYQQGIRLINLYKSKLPRKIYRNSFFRIYINYGEKCIRYKQRRKAIYGFFMAWKYKPLSIIPLKKSGKALLSVFK